MKDNTVIEDILMDMSNHGCPHLYYVRDRKWYCKVDLNAPASGAVIKIESDYGKADMHTTVQQCKERLVEYLATVQ